MVVKSNVVKLVHLCKFYQVVKNFAVKKSVNIKSFHCMLKVNTKTIENDICGIIKFSVDEKKDQFC